MGKKAFVDTNLPIAYLYHINSLYYKSKIAYDEYDELFWSHYVETEFNRRNPEKYTHLSGFYHDLQKYLGNPDKEFYSLLDLNNFAKNNYHGKGLNDVKGSINPFWSKYLGIQSKIPFNKMQDAINTCLNDLSILYGVNESKLKKIMHSTPIRTKKYSQIDSLLKLNGVSDKDRPVVLDGHDFAWKSSDPIDFITFDNECCNGAKQVKILSFNSIRGSKDFKFS